MLVPVGSGHDTDLSCGMLPVRMAEPTESPDEWSDSAATESPERAGDEPPDPEGPGGSAFRKRSDPPGKPPRREDPSESDQRRREFRGWGVTDRPTDVDSLGFADYVDVLEAFLTDENTEPPLTVGIEGEWGSGKSSFMRMLMTRLEGDAPPPSPLRRLRNRLRHWGGWLSRGLRGVSTDREPSTGADAADDAGAESDSGPAAVERTARGNLVVFFDPWRHDGEEAIWAAFALEFLRQIRRQLPWHRRVLGDLELAVRRVEWERGRSGIIVSGLLAAGVGVLTLLATAGLFLLGQAGVALAAGSVLSDPDPELVGQVAGGGGLTVSLVALLSVWRRARRRVLDPLRADLDRYLSDPGYDERVSFVARFNEDFARIVEAYRGDRSVFVFIDDLDRCSLPRAAELMGALTLLLESEPELYFLFGMDREKVAAGIAAKHDGLYRYLYEREEGVDSERGLGLRFGAEYLEKFVQVRVRIPQPGPDSLGKFLEDLDPGRESERGTHGPPPESRPAIRDPHRAELENAVRLAAPLLDYKPRSLKTFVNQYRLDAMLAGRRGWFDWEDDGGDPGPDDVTHERLALAVAEWLAATDLATEFGPVPAPLDGEEPSGGARPRS